MDLQATPAALPTPPLVAAPPAEAPDHAQAVWKTRIEESRKVRKELSEGTWRQNVNYRKNKPYEGESDKDRVAVPVDWSFTKSKEATLFSQVPTVILTPKHEKYKDAVPVFAKELNHILTHDVKIDVTMEESLADAINKSAIAGAKVGYIATFEDTQVPSMDVSKLPPAMQAQMMATGAVKMLPAKRMVDCKFYANRISPDQLLWPKSFRGSDFDQADWLGWDGSFTWAQAFREFGQSEERPTGLTEADRERVCGAADKERSQRQGETAADDTADQRVTFTEIFYNAAKDDPNELHLDKMRRKVFVDGIDHAVVDEDFKGQEWSDTAQSFIGVTKYPIRILTLTYISDEAIPPSDSEIGRGQVDEMMRSRSQMLLQRDRAQPLRWANSNRVDPQVLDNLNRGEYQQIIPVNGDGTTALGEVARAHYPPENWDFDRVQRQDLMEAWQVGANQTSGFDANRRTKGEADIVQANFQTRVAKERGKVSKYFLGIAECIAGYMQLYYQGPKENLLLSEEELARMQVWDREKVQGAKFVYTIREDSTVKLDSQQRIQQIERFLNLTAKSGFVNVEPVIAELAALSGLDPAQVVVAPEPKKPEAPNISLRAGGEELCNPMIGPYIVALLQKGYPVAPQDLEMAKRILLASSTEPAVAQSQAPGMPPGGAPQPPDDYGPMERVTKRVEEIGG